MLSEPAHTDYPDKTHRCRSRPPSQCRH
jgi:hypothetical protein